MMVPYLARLILSGIAAFFLLYAAGTGLVALIARSAIRSAEGRAARTGARLVLGLRLAPAWLAVALVVAVFMPGFVWLETQEGAERMGSASLAAASAGIAVWLVALARTVRAVAARGENPGSSPAISLVGVFKPRVVVSGQARYLLSKDEMAAALDHEEAHRAAHDNLKRLLLFATPRMTGQMAALERSWARLAEWAADDSAVGGDMRRATTLAAALVRVARLGDHRRADTLATCFAAQGRDLEARVDRLLNGRIAVQRKPLLSLSAGAGMALILAGVVLYPALLRAAHELMEVMIR